MRFLAFWGINLRTKECVFHLKKMWRSVYQSLKSIPTSNELYLMKTKLCTFARKQILRKPIKKLVKKCLKNSVHMTKA